MSVFNRRNALLGYATWMGLKVLARQKARQAMPSVDRETKRPNRSAIALGLASAAAVVGALVVLKSHSPDESE